MWLDTWINKRIVIISLRQPDNDLALIKFVPILSFPSIVEWIPICQIFIHWFHDWIALQCDLRDMRTWNIFLNVPKDFFKCLVSTTKVSLKTNRNWHNRVSLVNLYKPNINEFWNSFWTLKKVADWDRTVRIKRMLMVIVSLSREISARQLPLISFLWYKLRTAIRVNCWCCLTNTYLSTWTIRLSCLRQINRSVFICVTYELEYTRRLLADWF